MKFETKGGSVSHGEVYVKLLEDLTHSQEGAAMLAHLTRAQSAGPKDIALADGWIAVSELLKRMIHQVTKLATKKLN